MSVLIRRAAVAVAALLGALFAVGTLISILFELQGFGDRDSEPSGPYLLLLVLAFAASVGVPLVLWRALLPDVSGRVLAATLAGAAALALLVLGVSLR